jgi:hypothetical protein
LNRISFPLFISLSDDINQIIGERRGYLELRDIWHNEEAVTKLAAALAHNTTVTALEVHGINFPALQLSTAAWASIVNALKVNTTITSAFTNVNLEGMSAESLAAFELTRQYCKVRNISFVSSLTTIKLTFLQPLHIVVPISETKTTNSTGRLLCASISTLSTATWMRTHPSHCATIIAGSRFALSIVYAVLCAI